MARTLFVTGGAGFIGANFVHYWLETHPEDRVVVLDALTYAGNLENLKPCWNDSRFRFYPGLIQDSTVVQGIFRAESPTHVLNFAAESHNDRSMLDPGSLIHTNVFGVNVLLEACRKHGIERFLHVSTDEVYGEIGAGAFKETDPLGKPESLIKHIEDPRGEAHDKRYALTTEKLRGIGWKPESRFEDDLAKTVRWYVENESWWRPITESEDYQTFVRSYYGRFLGEDL